MDNNNQLIKERKPHCEKLSENYTNLLILNRDCWLLVCDLLSCQDILNMSKVSQSIRNLMQYIVLPSKFKKWEISFSRDTISLDDFNFLLSSIYTTVQALRILFLPDRHFELLKSYRFPNVTEFRITLSRPMVETDISNLSNVFPNLRCFSPHGICSKALELFTNLENLTLTGCRNLSKNDFGRILLALNLKSLTLDVFKKVTPLCREELLKFCKIEVLTLNRIELGWITLYDEHNAVTFDNLKVLIITGGLNETTEVDKLFENIHSIVPRAISSIEIANVSADFLYTYLNPRKYYFLNLVKVLKFINIAILDDVFGAPSKYKGLRQLYFFYCHTAMNLDVLSIISNSQELDVISFEQCDMSHIVISKAYINQCLCTRKKPIILNWYSSEKTPDVHCCNKYEHLIKLTNKSHLSSNYDSMTIIFK
ncbi:uncharacterized protein LOC114804160 [Zeugodacus cucurbitae]|uniref:uncharacterized protein LOC114804160 n=1 Tax=Zeugodacus cucurbitae TaxID=28588 RepID=UPI0023D91BA9|nr:uncharacterized protein LOC114804160 [Zeugodacus cucurbitae]